MNVDAARERNQATAEEGAERGPARSEPDAAPISEAPETPNTPSARARRSRQS